MDRYRITLTRDGRRFAILDREAYEYCGLIDDDGTVVPLEWAIRPAAEAWLQQCYRTWQAWEGNGAGRAPKGWKPHPPVYSPWDPSESGSTSLGTPASLGLLPSESDFDD